jgi:predicted membrane-bound spermidine synthase
MAAPRQATRAYTLTVFCAFTLSGCAGLIYQSVWAQYLGLFLGHAAYAQSLVLAIFMGGMAFGAGWVGTRGTAWSNLLRAYAWVELVIGIAAFAFHPVYLAATQFAYDRGFPALAGSGFASLFKWSLAALLIFPQSVLLGATFPLLSNALMRRLPSGRGAILALLYFSNSIGAAGGALLATFVLLPAVGLPGAMAAGALLNVLVALIAFGLARGDEPEPVDGATRKRIDAGPLLLLQSAAFITGATSFVYEIGWVRMLSLVFGSTVHAFELMLAAFIGGLACGALWIRRRIDRHAEPLRTGAFVQLAMGAAALVSLMLYDHCFDAVAWLLQTLPRTGRGYELFNVGTAVGAIAMMTPTAFFAGMTLPLFTLALIKAGGGERSVGRIYSANTLGAIAGIFAAVHWLIPQTGLKTAMIVAAAGDLALGLILLYRFPAKTRMARRLAVAASVVAILAVATLARFDPMAMAAGVYRNGNARFRSAYADVAFYRDGKTASVAATRGSDGTLAIATNGKSDASIQMRANQPPTLDEITMVMAAALPLSTHPAPRTAAVIGFGSGLTTHTLLGDPRLTRVDTIEIEPAMVEGARLFGSRVARAYDDPRSHLHFDDAKAYFAASSARYDIIVSEPSNPWVSGVAGLFSTEFYRFVPKHLTPGGLFVQWVQMYDIDDELVATIGRSLAASFSDFRVYLANDDDAIIVATAHGMLPALNDTVFREPWLVDELRHVGLAGLGDLAIRQVGDRRSLLPLFNELSQRTNSDFYPILSLEGPRARFVGRRPISLLGIGAADLPLREVLAHLAPVEEGRFVPNANFMPSQLAGQAALIAAALQTPDGPGAQTQIGQAVATMRSIVASCAGESGDSEKIDVIMQLAGRTIPFLGAGALQHVWIEPDWITCATTTDAVREMLAVIAALARRDFSLGGSDSIALLQRHRHILSPPAREWLLRAAMLAAIADGHYTDVAAFSSTTGRDIRSAGSNAMLREYLLAFAAAQQSPAPAR